jgi:acyl-CoA dehydrogenase
VFREQIEAFKKMLMASPPDEAQRKDIDFLLAGGEIFALVVYGQLILENANIYDVSDDLVDQIFDFMVRDFSRHALNLYSKPSSNETQMNCCLEMIRKPVMDDARYQRVWQQVHELKAEYEMSP